jgi:hypothetical protein
MSDRVTFYHNPLSRGRAVHRMLEEAQAPSAASRPAFKSGAREGPVGPVD